MIQYRFRKEGVVADYLRAGAGLALTAPALLVASLGPVGLTIMGSLAALFAVYGVRTWHRQALVIHAGEDGIAAAGPFGTRLSWDALAAMKLSYYSTSREAGKGWMQLTLKSGGRSLRVDSTLDGFEDVVALAARKARTQRLTLSHPTVENLRSLGINTDGLGDEDSERLR